MKKIRILPIMVALLISLSFVTQFNASTRDITADEILTEKPVSISEVSQKEGAELLEELTAAPKARLLDFKTAEMENCKIVGKSMRYTLSPGEENPVPAFWEQCFTDGTIASLELHPHRIHDDVLVGWYGDYNPQDNQVTCIVGIITKFDADIPEGMTAMEIPTSRFAVGTIFGDEPDIYMMAHQLTYAKLVGEKLEYDMSRGYEIEWYDNRFCQDDEYRLIDLYIPIK